jgi:hypothetical protein
MEMDIEKLLEYYKSQLCKKIIEDSEIYKRIINLEQGILIGDDRWEK